MSNTRPSEPMRILVLGAGVIGSVRGHVAPGRTPRGVAGPRRRLTDLRIWGLVPENSWSKPRSELSIPVVDSPEADRRYDLVVVAVRAEQLAATLPVLMGMNDGSDVLFFGNIAGHGPALIEALGPRALFGFPAAGGIQDGAAIRYVLIGQQKATLGEPSGTTSSRVRRLQTMFSGAGFPTTITANVGGWLLGHAAFIVPMAFAPYQVDTDAGRLAHDTARLRLMIRATRQAFQALRAFGTGEIPTNLTVLYLRMPERFVIHYWRPSWPAPAENYGSPLTAEQRSRR
jgi:2-dehydropantoate 2-reductase